MHFGNRFYNCSINEGTETVTQLIHLIQRLEAKGIWKKNQRRDNGKSYEKERSRNSFATTSLATTSDEGLTSQEEQLKMLEKEVKEERSKLRLYRSENIILPD